MSKDGKKMWQWQGSVQGCSRSVLSPTKKGA
jgi:hypothetical protein